MTIVSSVDLSCCVKLCFCLSLFPPMYVCVCCYLLVLSWRRPPPPNIAETGCVVGLEEVSDSTEHHIFMTVLTYQKNVKIQTYSFVCYCLFLHTVIFLKVREYCCGGSENEFVSPALF